MRRTCAVLCAFGLVAAAAAPARGASPDPKDLAVSPQELLKARELVQKLGSETYREREEAQAELAKMGRLARAVLAEAVAADADPEVRLRAARLLPKASAADLKARIDTFLEDKGGKFEHDLPGLRAYRSKLGGSDKARALYAELLKSPNNLELLSAVERGPAEAGRAVADRRNTLWMDMNGQRFNGSRPPAVRQPALGDVAAVLFVEVLVPADSIPKVGQWAYMNSAQFLQQGEAMLTLNGTDRPHNAAFRALAAQWIGTRTDPTEMSNIVYMLNNAPFAQFKEAQVLLRRIVFVDGVQLWARGQALNMLVQKNGRDEVPFLRAILRNELRPADAPELFPEPADWAARRAHGHRATPLANDAIVQQVFWQRPGQPQAQNHSIQMRDAALAFLLSQEKLNVRDYGFETQPGFNPPPGQQLYFGQYAFTSDERRTFGLVKYGWKRLKDGLAPPQGEPKDKK